MGDEDEQQEHHYSHDSSPWEYEDTRPLTPKEVAFLRQTSHWWMEKPERIEQSRSLVRMESDIRELIESRRFTRRITRHIKTFGAWLVGFVTFAVAVRDLFIGGKHG